jgi:hypothetical protein
MTQTLTRERPPVDRAPGADDERRPAASVAQAAPVLVVLALLAAGVAFHGAFMLRHWAPTAILVLVLLAAARSGVPRGPVAVAVGATWALAGWWLLSALWSPNPEAAVVEGARTAFYAGLLALPVVYLRSRAAALLAARALLVVLVVLVVATLLRILAGDLDAMLAGRLNEPVGYRNGTAALFAMAAVLLLCLAASRAAGVPGRAACFSLGTVALGLGAMTQSRGVLLGLLAGAAVAVVCGPDRLRRTYVIGFAMVGLAAVWGAVLAPYERFLDDRVTGLAETQEAATALLVLAIVTGGAMLGVALFDRGLRPSPGMVRGVRTAAIGLLAVIVAGAALAGVARVGNPVAFVGDKVEEFRTVEVLPAQGSRLGATGGQRYDLWRIAFRGWQDAPVAGLGAGAYEPLWYQERASDRNLSSPHSLPLGVLAEAGLIGLLALLTAIGAVGWAIRRRWAAADPTARRWSSALAGAAVVLLAQTTIDWLWEIPGLMGLAVLCAGIAVAVLPAAPGAAPRPARIALRAAPVLATLLVAALFLSDTYTREAREQRDGTPQQQLDAARAAQRLNPLATAPHYLAAGALERAGDREGARAELRDALDLEPTSFVTMTLLGDLETRAGDRAAARRWYRRALERNPRDAGLRVLARR